MDDGELVQALMVFSCGNVFINFSTASLDLTSVSIAKPDVTWSAFNAALSRTSGINESVTEKKPRRRHSCTETRRCWFGLSVS